MQRRELLPFRVALGTGEELPDVLDELLGLRGWLRRPKGVSLPLLPGRVVAIGHVLLRLDGRLDRILGLVEPMAKARIDRVGDASRSGTRACSCSFSSADGLISEISTWPMSLRIGPHGPEEVPDRLDGVLIDGRTCPRPAPGCRPRACRRRCRSRPGAGTPRQRARMSSDRSSDAPG